MVLTEHMLCEKFAYSNKLNFITVFTLTLELLDL